MKKNFYSTAVLTLFSIYVAKAQNTSIGVFGGANARNVSYGTYQATRLNLGADFGAFAEIRLAENFSFQPTLEYSAQGSKHGAFVSSSNYDNSELNNDVKFGELNYLMVPLSLKLSVGLGEKSPFRLYTAFGPYIGYLLSADQILINSNGQKVNVDAINVKSQLKSFNAGLGVNAGLSYYFKLSSVFIQAGGNYGLIRIQKDQTNGSNYAGAAAVTLGYTFWFDNNFLTNGHFHPRL